MGKRGYVVWWTSDCCASLELASGDGGLAQHVHRQVVANRKPVGALFSWGPMCWHPLRIHIAHT
jgi:hypothetical protein